MNADANNLAPRVGFAWRVKPGTVVRGGYGISFNSGSYAAIARQLVAQPPFAVTNTSIRSRVGEDRDRACRTDAIHVNTPCASAR